mmetsp:Transcript_59886/g.110907  ORF Transcript_59886/g.110907 Transcript_59886/m.110907 type:complete len:431 (-) Transcript_59886:88-1380(-)
MEPLVVEQGSNHGAARSVAGKGMSMRSAVFNLTNTIIGAGTLTMPYAFAQTGLLGANIIAGVVMLVTAYSAWLLLVASTNCQQGGTQEAPKSFQDLGRLTCGPKAALFAMATFIVGGLGTLTGYLIFIGRLLAQVGEEVFDVQMPHIVPIVAVTCLVVLPLGWRQRIDALKYVSFLALVAISYVACMFCSFLLVDGPEQDAETGHEEVELLRWTSHSINSFTLMIGAFCVHNTVLPIYADMQSGTPRAGLKTVLLSIFIAFVVYEALGLSAYILLGPTVPGNCLLGLDGGFAVQHPGTKVPSILAKVSMAFILAVSAPLAVWPCRSAICSLFWTTEAAPSWAFRVVTLMILAIVMFLAAFCPDVTVPLGLVNSVAGGSMVFLMPGCFYLGSLEESERMVKRHYGARAMILIGLVVCILGFGLEVRSIMEK